MVYFTSDWHFCHSKPFIWEPRGFKNQWEMNEAIISKYNSIVQPEDDVYCLGDVMLNDNEEGLRCLKQLKGKIHIIRGNHCNDTRLQLYATCYNVVEVCDAKYLKVGKQNFFLSHYPCLCSNKDNEKPLKTRTINLCGHSHYQNRFKDMDKGLIYHVECDAHKCTPVSVDEILKDINFFISLNENAQVELYKKNIY